MTNPQVSGHSCLRSRRERKKCPAPLAFVVLVRNTDVDVVSFTIVADVVIELLLSLRVGLMPVADMGMLNVRPTKLLQVSDTT